MANVNYQLSERVHTKRSFELEFRMEILLLY